MTKSDRRVQRTRERLQQALIELFREREYDAITVQDIVDRANVGRSTFYLHFNSKDELFISCHEAIVDEFYFELLHPFSREQLLSAESTAAMTAAFRHLEEERTLLNPIFRGMDGMVLVRRLRGWCAQQIEAGLRAALAEADGSIPFDVLANYLAGAQIALVQLWLEKRRPHTPENMAQTFHRLQRAIIRDALGLRNDE